MFTQLTEALKSSLNQGTSAFVNKFTTYRGESVSGTFCCYPDLFFVFPHDVARDIIGLVHERTWIFNIQHTDWRA